MASTDPAHTDASFAALIPLGSHANAAPIEIKRPVTIIGSRKDIVRLHLQSSTVSKGHCVIVLNAWGCYVHDLASRTGTMVNGKPIVDKDLAEGDVIQVGRFQFKYRAPKKVRPKPIPLPTAELSISTLTGPLTVHKRVLIVGRRAGADVQFEDSRVSNIHALIIEQDNRRLVRDLSSRSGTWLDDQPIHQEPFPDGADLKIGGATLRIADRPTPSARSADAPFTLADPAPAAAVGLDALDLAPLGQGLADLDLDTDIAESHGGFRPDDTLPAADDDLAALRRNWKSPVRPAEPIIESPRPPEPNLAESEVEIEAEQPDLEAPDLEPLELEPDLEVESPEAEAPVAEPILTPPAEPAVQPIAIEPVAPVIAEAPAPEVAAPEVVHAAPAEPVEIDLAKAEAAERLAEAEAEAEADDLDLIEPLHIEPLDLDDLSLDPDAPEVDIEALAAEALAEAPAKKAEPKTEIATEAEAIELDELELDLDAPAPKADAIGEAKNDDLDLAHLDPDAPATAIEAGEAVLPPELSVPTAKAEIAEPEVAEIDPAAVEAREEAPETASVDLAEAEAELEPLDLEPLDLGDLSLELDADAPAVKAEEPANIDALTLDPYAPALAEATETPVVESAEKQAIATENELSDTDDPFVSEMAAVVSDTLSPADDLAEDLSDTATGLVELDTVEPDLAADADTTTEDIETESAVPWTTPAAIDKAATIVSETDLVDLSADLEADEREATEHAAIAEAKSAEAKPVEEATPADVIGDLPKPDLAQASAETIAVPVDGDLANKERTDDEPSLDDLIIGRLPGDGADDDIADSAIALIPEPPTDEASAETNEAENEAVAHLGDTLATDSLTAVAFIEPPEAPVEPDRIRLSEDAEDEDSGEDTALAVDLGLVLEDEHGHDDHSGLHGLIEPAALAPVPADPVDIDLADARPVDRRADDSLTGSLDLSHLGLTDDRPTFTAYNGEAAIDTSAADEHAAEDIFDVDDLELIEPEATQPPAYPLPAAEAPPHEDAGEAAEAKKPNAPDADDEISPPSGGSLADLMPGGPPLLGGSFMSIPSIPRPSGPAGGPTGKRRPMRVGFGQDEPRGRRAAPFAAERTIADAMGGVDADETIGDLMAAGPSIDAFSGAPATTPANGVGHADIEDDVEAVPADAFLAPAERFRPRGVIRPVVPMPADGLSTTAPSNLNRTGGASAVVSEPLVSAAPLFEIDPNRALRHKRRVRRVIACIVAMLVLIGGAAWAVYTFMPIKSTVDALISFDGLDRLGTDEAVAFQNKQNSALTTEPVRQKAIQNLPPSVRDAGFLVDGMHIKEAVDSDRKTRWPIEQPTVMRLRVRSTDKEADVARVRALGDAMIKTGEGDREQINSLKTKIQEKQGLISQRRVQIGNLADDLQALQQATATRGSVKDRSALNTEYLAAEPALTAIKSKRQELEATIVRLKLPASAATSAPSVDPVASDEELARLSKQLSDLQQPMLRPESTSAGAEARKNLDASIAQFQQDLASAQKLRDNPELTAYVEAANGMFTQFRQLTEGFIRRQENNRTRLSELKATLSDKQQDRTQKLLETDTELKQLKDNLAILERQHNAAEAQGLVEEAKKSDLELRLLRVKIGEREDKFKNDTGFGEAITGIQNVIDQSEKESSIDRKSIDERLTALQADFMKNAPAVEKLPAEQKALAEGFEKKLAAMNDARRAYDAAADQAQQQAKANEAAAAEKVAALRLQIAARRQDVLTAVKARQAEDDEATRKTRLAAAQTELDNVRQQEQAASHRLADAAAAIETAEKQRRIETSAEADRQAKSSQRDTAERELRNVQGDVATLQASLARLIVPDPKLEMQVYDDVDRRPIIAGLAAGGIALLLLIPIIMDLLALAREHHPHHATPASDVGGFEPVLVESPEQKSLPEPASV